MKSVEWTDKDGYKHLSLLRDNDPDDLAPHGILRDPPDLSVIDWDAVQRDLHNLLVSKRLITWEDVQASQNGLTSSVLTALKRKIITLYREQESFNAYD